jgi:hypothetical protein
MTKEEIIRLLNRKIKEATKVLERDYGHNTEAWHDYYSGVTQGLKDARGIIGMLDKQNNRLG